MFEENCSKIYVEIELIVDLRYKLGGRIIAHRDERYQLPVEDVN